MSGTIPRPGLIPRQYPTNNQPGNPLHSQPNLAPGAWDPTGRIPEPPLNQRGAEAWGESPQFQRFASNGVNQVWVYTTPVFDCAPEVSAGYGHIASAVPINHEVFYGQRMFLNLILGEASGTAPPALTAGISGTYAMEGASVDPIQNPVPQVAASTGFRLQRITPQIPCSGQIFAGGTTTAITNPQGPFGASVIQVLPPTSLRFWRVVVTITITGVAPIALPYFIHGSLH